MASIRRASAVLLTRGEGEGLEVYLVERSPALRFYGGYWALPGGVIDPILDAGEPSPGGAPERSAQHVRCAHRELFEETGVLLGNAARLVSHGERDELRRELLTEDARHVYERWCEVTQRIGFQLGQAPEFARVVTPPFAARLYETSFHHARLPAGETPEVDGSEAVAGAFVRPEDVLERWLRGELYVVPPTLSLMTHLARHGLERGLEQATASSAEIAAGRLSGACQSPGIFVAPLKTPTIPPATTTNTYLVGAESTYVVDPATYEDDERLRLIGLCDAAVAGGQRIAAVLLTHHHADHIGSAAHIARRYSVPIGAHRETLARVPLDGAASFEINDGDELPLGTAPDGSPGWSLRALFTPGHAPGHLAFVESFLRGALVGDLVSTLSTIVIDPPGGHMATYLRSLERLVTERIRILHPAHGMPVRDGVEVVRGYLRHREAREAKLLAALTTRPQSPGELVRSVYDDTPIAMHELAERSLLAGLQKLEEEGRAAPSSAGWTRA